MNCNIITGKPFPPITAFQQTSRQHTFKCTLDIMLSVSLFCNVSQFPLTNLETGSTLASHMNQVDIRRRTGPTANSLSSPGNSISNKVIVFPWYRHEDIAMSATQTWVEMQMEIASTSHPEAPSISGNWCGYTLMSQLLKASVNLSDPRIGCLRIPNLWTLLASAYWVHREPTRGWRAHSRK